MNGTGNRSGNRAKSVPRFELIDKDDAVCGYFYSAGQAALEAQRLWPTQKIDPDRTGDGWDVRVAGS